MNYVFNQGLTGLWKALNIVAIFLKVFENRIKGSKDSQVRSSSNIALVWGEAEDGYGSFFSVCTYLRSNMRLSSICCNSPIAIYGYNNIDKN